MKRFVCHFLIVWLALLSGGAYAHSAADAAQDRGHIRGHIAAQLVVADDTGASFDTERDRSHSETSSYCGHATDTLATLGLRFNDAVVGAALPVPTFWVSHEHPNSIERPKWSTTTSSVVNL